jgi:tetratricopeptide (TPR) repeat protein
VPSWPPSPPRPPAPLTARLKDSLGLDPPPAETPHRDLLTRLVALATPLPDRPRLLLLHGAPGSGRSALARAVAHHVPLESIWLTFAHRPHRGWAPTAWATNDILPGRPWKVPPPPWLESLFDLLEARPRLYIIEDADAVASADLLAWLPRRNAVVVLITLRNLRPPGSPEIHRFAVEAGASVEVSAVEANLLATAAHFGALTRAALAAAAGVEVGEVSAGIARGFLALQPEARVRAAHPRPLRLDGAQLAASTRRLADHLLKSGEGVPDEPLVGTVLENLRGLCRGGTPADFHLAGQVVDRLIESQPLQPLAHDLVEVAAELAEWMVDHAATHFDLVRLGRLLKLLGRLDQAAATLRAADEAEQTPLVAIHLWNIARERGDEVEQARLLELIAGRSTHAEARVRAFLLLIHSDVGADSTAELPAVLADLRKELVTHYSVGGVAILIELLRIADQPADADRALDTLRRRFPCALNLRSPRRGGDAQKALRWAEANGEVGYVRWHDIPVADHRRWAELYRRALAELPLDDEDRLQATGRLLLVAREHPELAPELVPLALSALERFQFPKGQWAQKAQGWRQEAADILKPKPKSKPQLPQPAPPPTFIDLFKDFFKL